jgi:hypothetical protein
VSESVESSENNIHYIIMITSEVTGWGSWWNIIVCINFFIINENLNFIHNFIHATAS